MTALRATIRDVLTPPQLTAVAELVRRIRVEVRADLVRAFLFGSRARGQERPDSDIDILLVFRRLPPGREPHAGHAETIAEEVAACTSVPVTVWSVSLPDLDRGNRTPMLVDALDDGIPVFPPEAEPHQIAFTPEDAVWCAGQLLQRVEEGGAEAADHYRARRDEEAAHRLRDDVVRLCTAALLLHGETRPRRGDAVLRYLEEWPGDQDATLRWAASAFGPPGHEEDAPVAPPPGGFARAAATVERLRRAVVRGRAELAGELRAGARSLRSCAVYQPPQRRP
ncbi:MAG TPA: nucleotidyltransferase domain-containing protein [Longimicrobium sp.]|nr:nucleotidyltransferase domain-containing protein [Longimicrobium sp.]